MGASGTSLSWENIGKGIQEYGPAAAAIGGGLLLGAPLAGAAIGGSLMPSKPSPAEQATLSKQKALSDYLSSPQYKDIMAGKLPEDMAAASAARWGRIGKQQSDILASRFQGAGMYGSTPHAGATSGLLSDLAERQALSEQDYLYKMQSQILGDILAQPSYTGPSSQQLQTAAMLDLASALFGGK